MKIFFMSDIHGSEYYLNKALEAYEREKCEYIVILGDILYHGPRNDIPKGYNPKSVANTLNKLKNKIMCVKGNCDGEVDQMMIEFPILCDYSTMLYNGKRLFLTHGHKYNKNNMLPIDKGDVIISGHTHVPVCEEIEGIYFINPGSITFPKENTKHSYGILEDNKFTIKDLSGESVLEITIE